MMRMLNLGCGVRVAIYASRVKVHPFTHQVTNGNRLEPVRQRPKLAPF